MKREEILIVCNDSNMSKALTKLLTKEGYKALRAKDTEEVFSKLKESIPGVIILDVDVFDKEKTDIRAELENYISNASIPVLLLVDKTVLECKLKGVDSIDGNCIIKPYNPEDLIKKVDLALEKKRLYDEVSMTDTLTGLYNYNFFTIQLNLFMNMAKRYKQKFSLLIIDVVKLKMINETYGIEAGDLVLKKISFELKRMFRKTDLVFKHVNDEFAIILPETDYDQSKVVVKKVKKGLKDKLYIYSSSGERITFAVKIGSIEYEYDFENFKDMVDAVYANIKKSGKKTG